jgi:hypothetical protein
MEYLGVNGTTTRIPYSQNNVTVVEDSVTLVYNGFAEVTDSNSKEYAINIYGSEKTFFEQIKLLTLKDIYPSTPVLWTADNLLNYVNATENFCFPVAQYNTDTFHTYLTQIFQPLFTKTKALETSPHFFVKYLFESIFTHLGYTLSFPSSISNDEVYKNLVISSQKGVSNLGVVYDSNFDIKQCVHEVGVDVFLKEIMYRYGLIIKVDEFKKKITFTRMNDLLSSAIVYDWTDKFVETKSEKYSIGSYGQNNYLAYSDDVIDDAAYALYPDRFGADVLRGSFAIDNTTLDKEKTIIDSAFSKAKLWGFELITTGEPPDIVGVKGRLFTLTGIVGGEFLFNVSENELLDDGTKKPRENPFSLMYLKTLSEPINYTILDDVNSPHTLTNTTARVCTNDNLSFQSFIDNNYGELINLLDNMVVVKAVMNLSVIDIYKFDFFRRIYLQQFGANFYVNRINNYQKNKLVEVELIKIPTIID